MKLSKRGIKYILLCMSLVGATTSTLANEKIDDEQGTQEVKSIDLVSNNYTGITQNIETKLEVINQKYNELGKLIEKYNDEENKPREIIATHETAEVFMQIIRND